MILFAILFGLSMDYEVFLLSRIKEEYDVNGNDNREAVAHGLAVTARVITAAAAIMVCVFGSFVLAPDRDIKEFGVGLAVAVLIDATVVRMVLVPATMALLGHQIEVAVLGDGIPQAGCPVEHGPHAGHQLVEVERLGQVVVPAPLEPGQLVAGEASGGQEDNRGGGAGGPEPAAHLEAVGSGHHHVEHDQSGCEGGHGGQGLRPVGDGLHLEPGVAERGGGDVAEELFIVGHEDPVAGGIAGGHLPPPPMPGV
jgi:hypothetical protein